MRADTAILVLTSVRAPGGETLSIKVERLDGRTEASALTAAAPAAPAATANTRAPRSARGVQDPAGAVLPRAPTAAAALRIEINAHIRSRGDMTFGASAWAGRISGHRRRRRIRQFRAWRSGLSSGPRPDEGGA